MSANPWPWPEESREDRAKRVARSYRDLVRNIANGAIDDPAGECHRLDQHWANHGVQWLIAQRTPLDPDDWLTAADLAQLIDRPRKDLYNWARLGHLEQRTGPDGAPEYSVASVLAYQRKLNQRRRSANAR